MRTYKYTDHTKRIVHVIEEDGKSYSSMPVDMVPEKTLIDGVLVKTPILPWISTLSEWKDFVKEAVTKKREQVEVAGTIINGTPIKTDQESQGKINRALAIVSRKTNKVIPFKVANNKFSSINKAQIEEIADGVGDFLVACYAAEEAHYNTIDSLTTIKACENYYNNVINTGWPSNGN